MSHGSTARVVAFACAALAAASPAPAAGPGAPALSGEWAVLIVQPASGCEWSGMMRLREERGRLTGDGAAEPPIQPRSGARCPRLEGSVRGERRGERVRFGFATGELGQADFEGSVDLEAKAMSGHWRTRSARGDWWASR